jgi:hypothetical protein
MPRSSLGERVAALEREVVALKASSISALPKKNWRRSVGMFTDDPEMQRLFQQAIDLREADRARARRRPNRRQRSQA